MGHEHQVAGISVRHDDPDVGYKGPAQPSPTLGDALNAGYGYLEVRCLGCDTSQTVALDIVRRPKHTPIHELERYMRCKDCSKLRGYPYKRSCLVGCGRPGYRRSIRPRPGGRGSGDGRRTVSRYAQRHRTSRIRWPAGGERERS
jgi:hypothetical protein